MFSRVIVAALLCGSAAASWTTHDLHELMTAVKGDDEVLRLSSEEGIIKLNISKEPYPGIHETPQSQEVVASVTNSMIHFKTTWTTPGDGLDDFPTANTWNAAFSFAKVSLVMNDHQTYAVMHLDQMFDPSITKTLFGAFAATSLDIFKSSVRNFDREFLNFYVAKANAEQNEDGTTE